MIFLSTAIACISSVPGVTVEAPAGLVTGLRITADRFGVALAEPVDVFRGIRYGRAERFGAAEPYSYSSGKISATDFGPWCYQASFPEQPDPTNVYSEDCLLLNLWRPHDPSEATLPVLFYIHGGGFKQGGGADALFDGARLALAARAVVVTINYRLGPLGFLVTHPSGAGGMNGLADAVLALKWVRSNVASFGGDASRVALFGESAGGCATCVLACSDAARGLFSVAIVESGACVGPW